MNPAALEVLARAEKRLTGHIAAHGIDAQALAICATYEQLLEQATRPLVVVPAPISDAMAIADDLARHRPLVIAEDLTPAEQMRCGQALDRAEALPPTAIRWFACNCVDGLHDPGDRLDYWATPDDAWADPGRRYLYNPHVSSTANDQETRS